MKKKKNRFWLFIFSLCPGAGHMYMGFMKMGLSFLLGFLLSCALVSLTGLDVFAVIPATIYIYAFFHANNIGSLDDAGFYALEDAYLFGFDSIGSPRLRLEGKSRSIAAVVLILIGIFMLSNLGFDVLWHYVGNDNPVMRLFYYTVRDVVPRVLMAIAVIWFGIYLLRGKKAVLKDEEASRKQEPMRIEEKEQCVSGTAGGQSEQNSQN